MRGKLVNLTLYFSQVARNRMLEYVWKRKSPVGGLIPTGLKFSVKKLLFHYIVILILEGWWVIARSGGGTFEDVLSVIVARGNSRWVVNVCG